MNIPVPNICHSLFLNSTNEIWEFFLPQLNTLISCLSLRSIFPDYRWCSPHHSEAGVSRLWMASSHDNISSTVLPFMHIVNLWLSVFTLKAEITFYYITILHVIFPCNAKNKICFLLSLQKGESQHTTECNTFVGRKIYCKDLGRKHQQFSLPHERSSLPSEKERRTEGRGGQSMPPLHWVVFLWEAIASDWEQPALPFGDDLASNTGTTAFISLLLSASVYISIPQAHITAVLLMAAIVAPSLRVCECYLICFSVVAV